MVSMFTVMFSLSIFVNKSRISQIDQRSTANDTNST